MSEIRPTLARGKPRGMEVAHLGSREAREFIESEAIDIFATMTNGGCTFQQALGAVFLSGMNLAHTLKEKSNGRAREAVHRGADEGAGDQPDDRQAERANCAGTDPAAIDDQTGGQG